jgi:hypothetical protein
VRGFHQGPGQIVNALPEAGCMAATGFSLTPFNSLASGSGPCMVFRRALMKEHGETAAEDAAWKASRVTRS